MHTTKSPKQRILSLFEDLVNPGPNTNRTVVQTELNKLLSAKPILIKFFLNEIKRCLSIKMDKQQLFNLFSLIEGVTNKCSLHMQKELNNTVFLDLLLKKLKGSGLDDKAEKKLLGLFKLWNDRYGGSQSKFTNFTVYYERLKEDEYEFPQPRRYSLNLPFTKPLEQKKTTMPENHMSLSEMTDIDISSLEESHKVHFKELVFILSRIKEVNKLIDNRDYFESEKAMKNLTVIEDKIRFLPKKFKDSKNCFLYKLSTAVLLDINASRIRYDLGCSGLPTAEFLSKSIEVLLEYKSQTIKTGTYSCDSDSDKNSQQEVFPVKKHVNSHLILSSISDKEFFMTKENFESKLENSKYNDSSIKLGESDIKTTKTDSIGKYNTADNLGGEDFKMIVQRKESLVSKEGKV